MNRAWRSIAGGALALTLLAAACGSSDDNGVATLGSGSASATASSSGGQDTEQALLDYAGCMRDEGIDFPDPQVGSDGQIGFGGGGGPGSAFDPSSQEFQDANGACSHLLPNGGQGPDLSPEEQAALNDAQLEFARCMRDNGIEDFPDPTPGDGFGFGGGGNSQIDPNDPDVQAAFEICQPILSDVLPGAPGGGGQ